jgi:multicomponent Na+:H+ antiporter subunit G
MELLIYVCLGIGLFFNVIGVIGLLRFPDVYTRLHAETKTTTFGSIFLGIAVIVYALTISPTLPALAVHTAIAVIVLAFTNATGSHAIAQAAYQSGIKPVDAVVDKLSEEQA